ncbi:GAF domain-containing sensor histidine kinase [Sagittula salina]|uniref:histidine kinase n=1 Tax=Sagittula salina TaxID=2820268 RepID=A0A940S3J1_9RHOB|nr:GAF domain-containing sensor histidine kinase [Sagittula salina]MBP0485147.1 GAF domain-containing sensor histidine kinase [Sagittula salina]
MAKQHDFQVDIDAVGRSNAILTLLETVTLATGMGFAAVARVTKSRWVTCRAVDRISFGLSPGDELEVESTLCHEVRQHDQEIVIDDVHTDPDYVNHHCPARYGFRGYISVPIHLADGSFFGTLCAIDPNPQRVKDDRVLSMFRLFAKMIGEILDADEALSESRNALVQERRLSKVQEQFIAILAHDLRNPVNAVTAGLRLLQRRDLDDRARELVDLMRGSVNRMGLLIENLLDQARSRSGRGIVVERMTTHGLGPALEQIIAELQPTAPDQEIVAHIDVPEAVDCDVSRVCQLFSNLLANAVTHGASNAPIEVDIKASASDFRLSVANSGARIPDDMMPNLFLPFERSNDRPSREGLGLGLFIASEIAKGHGGTLSVTSDDDRTVFTFEMSCGRVAEAEAQVSGT